MARDHKGQKTQNFPGKFFDKTTREKKFTAQILTATATLEIRVRIRRGSVVLTLSLLKTGDDIVKTWGRHHIAW